MIDDGYLYWFMVLLGGDFCARFEEERKTLGI
jgi:hypothetical protein